MSQKLHNLITALGIPSEYATHNVLYEEIVAELKFPDKEATRATVLGILSDNDHSDGGGMRWHPSGEPTERAHAVADRIVSELSAPTLIPIREGHPMHMGPLGVTLSPTVS